MILAVNKADLVAGMAEEDLEEHMTEDYLNNFA